MNVLKTCTLLLVLSCLLFLSGCASTRVVTSWSDESFRIDKFKRPLVLATVQKQIIRSNLEDDFVKEFRSIGIDAIQSYKLFPDMEDLKPTRIKSKLSGSDRDSVLTIRLVDVKNEAVQVAGRTDVYSVGGGYAGQPRYNSFGAYYNESYSVVSTPGYIYEYKVFVVETNLYDASNDKLVWSMMTETEEPHSIDAALQEFVSIAMKDLKKQTVTK